MKYLDARTRAVFAGHVLTLSTLIALATQASAQISRICDRARAVARSGLTAQADPMRRGRDP
jgi:hypothetical protein